MWCVKIIHERCWLIDFINVFTSSILCWFSWLVCVGCCGRYFICSWFGRVIEARMVSSLPSNHRKKYEGIILQLCPYTTLVLEGEGRSITCPHCFTPGKGPSTHSTGGWVAFGTCFLVGGFEHQTIQPAAGHYANYTNPAAFLLHTTPCKTQTLVSNSTEDHIWLVHTTHTWLQVKI